MIGCNLQFHQLLSTHRRLVMLNTPRLRALLYLVKGVTFPKPYPIFHHHYHPSPFSLRFCTNTSSHSRSFGISPESASKLCSSYSVRFETAEKPDSVLSFFRNHGFSNSQVHNLIIKAPWLLSCDPCKRVLPKFEFFLSKGASTSDIVNFVSKNPIVLYPSLENHIVPTYELVYRFLQSDKDVIALLIYNPALLGDHDLPHNIRVLIENGMTDSNIARLLRSRSMVFNTTERAMVKVVEELKDLGFHPSNSTFTVALFAKTIVTKTLWKKKVDAFKKWGWSDEDVMEAFKRRPHCMLTSVDKINLVMSFWVNQLGWDAMSLAKGPWVLGPSLERTVIPRAAVLQFLLKKGLRKKNAGLTSPFTLAEKLFVDRFIKCFREDSSDLLKLYEEKLNLVHTKNNGMSCSILFF